MPKISPISGADSFIAQKLSQLKMDTVYAAVMGDYKAFKTAQKQYAKIAVDNFELASSLKSPQVKSVPLFSKVGLNMLKCFLLNKLRIKTPEEKRLKQLGREARAKSYIKV